MNEKPARDALFTGVFALLVTATACAFVLLASPRPIVPRALPPLVLDAQAEKACLAADKADAQSRPSDQGVRDMYRGFLSEGLLEQRGPTDLDDARVAQSRFATLTELVTSRIGKDGVRKLRAYAVEQFERALADQLRDKEEQKGLIGTFDKQLKRYGLMDAQGEFIAPRLSVRAMYKVRWNIIHSLSLIEGLRPVEIQAFEGFLALHSATTPPARRAEAARAFHDAGGFRGDWALATWLYQGGKFDRSSELMKKAGARGELYARNFQLAIDAQRALDVQTP